MDTVTDYIAKKNGNHISQFIIAGASKRGWTTWTTAAVDPRVIAIVPLVMGLHASHIHHQASVIPADMLNAVPNLHHFYQAYCGWSFALEPYCVLPVAPAPLTRCRCDQPHGRARHAADGTGAALPLPRTLT